jgi:hypothetical protein
MFCGQQQRQKQNNVFPSMFQQPAEYVTWTFSPNNNGIAHQGRAGIFGEVTQ